jgi:transcriptional regulator GlxA family with amidase domain
LHEDHKTIVSICTGAFRYVDMSPRNFARVYLAKSGRTPAKMVEALRLEAACRLLEETDLPLKRIAALSGHMDEQNLRRTFLRRMSVTPSEYRNRFSAHDEPVSN